MTITKQLRHVVSAAVILLGVMGISAYGHSSHVHLDKTSVLSRALGEKVVLHSNHHTGVNILAPAKASGLREKTSARTEIVRAAFAPMTALDEDPSMEGSGCVREHCNCGASTHGNPWCYTNGRGDCPNHQGLLCIWQN